MDLLSAGHKCVSGYFIIYTVHALWNKDCPFNCHQCTVLSASIKCILQRTGQQLEEMVCHKPLEVQLQGMRRGERWDVRKERNIHNHVIKSCTITTCYTVDQCKTNKLKVVRSYTQGKNIHQLKKKPQLQFKKLKGLKWEENEERNRISYWEEEGPLGRHCPICLPVFH